MMVIMMAITLARTKMIQYDYHDDYDAADEHDEYEGCEPVAESGVRSSLGGR